MVKYLLADRTSNCYVMSVYLLVFGKRNEKQSTEPQKYQKKAVKCRYVSEEIFDYFILIKVLMGLPSSMESS